MRLWRRKSYLLKRKSSRLQTYWEQLPSSTQRRLRGFAWAASSHFLLAAVLSCIGLVMPQAIPSLELSADFTDTQATETFTLMEDLHTPELPEVIEELDTSTAQASSEAATDESLKSLDLFAGETTADSMDISANEVLGDDSSSLISDTERRVALKGGELDGEVRFSLAFEGDDDLDLHVQYHQMGRARRNIIASGFYPLLRYIFYRQPRTEHGALDVDSNASSVDPSPAENVVFTKPPALANYVVGIHHFRSRGVVEPTPYVLVVKYGKRKRVFKGTLLPRDGLKVIHQFRYRSNGS